MKYPSSFNKKLIYIIKINKYNKICRVCRSSIMCDMCHRFGKIEGEKWMRQKQSYHSD